MNPEEAIEDIRKCIQPSVGGKSLQMAIEALEKQIPKKVTFRSEYLCGNCNITINSEDCYCYNCGQRQDWSED